MKMKVLLVDIDDNLKKALGNLFDKIFTGKQYDLIQVNLIRKALEIIKNNHIDLMITDLQLLDGSGISLLIQVQDSFPDIPKIVLSAYTDLISKEDMKLLGINYFFQKPPNLHTLKQGIEQILQLKKEENME
jgi:DNA-binding NtrC family response regulator